MDDLTRRTEVLRSFGAEGTVLSELLEYNRNVFERSPELQGQVYPLADEPFVAVWADYLDHATANDRRPIATLKAALAQLNFPITQGISQDPRYRAVTLKGEPTGECELATGLPLADPDGIRLRLQQTMAGRIPVISVAHRPDFELLLQALTHRNEPMAVPAAMGAVMVSGYNNWDRIARYRREWAEIHPGGDWAEAFRELIPHKARYQDRFIVVSSGPYSGVSADAFGLSDEAWSRLSLEIRIHHECAHYAMKRIYGFMRNNLLDEVIADYMGLLGATGAFRAEWFLRFMGLEDYPAYRPAGRLEVYRGEPPLSDEAFAILRAMLMQVAASLELLRNASGEVPGPIEAIEMLTATTLEQLAGLSTDVGRAG